MDDKVKIGIFGAGFVGLAHATLLSTQHKVTLIDLNEKKVERVNNRIDYTGDPLISKFFKEKNLDLEAKTHLGFEDRNCQVFLLCLPTDYDNNIGHFNTKILEDVIKEIKSYSNEPEIILKSTIPIGFTRTQNSIYQSDNISYCPEFLREGTALQDCLTPSRVIIGGTLGAADNYKAIIQSFLGPQNEFIECGSSEAELIKLASNNYLAMRVAFFNELDTLCLNANLDTEKVISGICSDDRIGVHYNNPSFGLGG